MQTLVATTGSICYDGDPRPFTGILPESQTLTPSPPPSPPVEAQKPRKSLLIVRFPGDGTERQECVDWLVNCAWAWKDSPDIELLPPVRLKDTPIDMVRNLAVMKAKKMKADYLVMVDNDIEPDYQCGRSGNTTDFNPEAKQFLASSIAFLEKLDRPAIIAAPYCGPPPESPVYVFDWEWTGDVEGDGDFKGKLAMIPRNDAAHRVGIQQVAAIPTGLVLIDMRVFETLPAPWFYYETATKEWTKKASTEDVTFSRDAAICGIPVYCNWDAWCRHWKSIGVGKPLRASVDIVHPKIQKIVAEGFQRGDRYSAVSTEPEWPGWLTPGETKIPVLGDSKKSPVVMVG